MTTLALHRLRSAWLQRLAAALFSLAGSVSQAHEYPEPGFTIIHPWVTEAPKGTPRLAVSMRIVQIAADDRLLSASTPVAAAMELWPPASPDSADAAKGIPLIKGRELTINLFGPHFVLRDVNTDLLFGREYPLTLVFEKAGVVSAGLIIGTH